MGVMSCNLRVMVNKNRKKKRKQTLADMGGVIRLFWGYTLI